MVEATRINAETPSALVVGTSNSIMKGGWYDGFVSAYPGQVTRCAVGGAPFSQFLGKMSKVLERKFDHIIVDTSPNDETFSAEVGSRWIFEKLYVDFITILTSRALTSVIRIPPEPFLGVPTNVSKIQEAICDQLGATYIDLSSYLKIDSNSQSTYIDKYHPNTELSFRLGMRLAAQVISNKSERRGQSKDVAIAYFEDYGVNDALTKELVKTGLLSETLVLVPQDQILRLPDYRMCFGFFVNKAKCNALIRLHGLEDNRDIACYFDAGHQPDRPGISFVPIKNGFVMNCVSVVRPWQANEYALHSRLERGPYFASIGPFVCHSGI
jgi:hypothetical protein